MSGSEPTAGSAGRVEEDDRRDGRIGGESGNPKDGVSDGPERATQSAFASAESDQESSLPAPMGIAVAERQQEPVPRRRFDRALPSHHGHRVEQMGHDQELLLCSEIILDQGGSCQWPHGQRHCPTLVLPASTPTLHGSC